MVEQCNSFLVDGNKIKELRKQKFTTQQRFAEKIRVSEKTIQRAEKGESIKREVVNEMAKALNVDITELLQDSETSSSELVSQKEPPHHEFLRLKQLSSASDLFAATKSDLLDFDFNLDLDQDTANEIASFIEPIEALNLRITQRRDIPPASEQLRIIGGLSAGLQKLSELCICVFIGSTTFRETNSQNYPTDSDYEIYVHSIIDQTKTVIQFAECNTKTVNLLTYVGLTLSEARKFLTEKQRNKLSNESVEWGDYTIVDFDDDIPF